MRTKKPIADKTERASSMPLPEIADALPVEDIKRMSFAIDSQGNILWDRMHGRTKEQLKAMLGNPDTAKALGIEPSASTSTSTPIEIFDPEWTGSLLESLGKVESFLASKMYKIDSDISEQAFTYSEREKEKLSVPLSKVINKYASVWMVQFKDEIALAFLFVTITAVKLQMATTLQKMRDGTGQTPTSPQQKPESVTDVAKVEWPKKEQVAVS